MKAPSSSHLLTVLWPANWNPTCRTPCPLNYKTKDDRIAFARDGSSLAYWFRYIRLESRGLKPKTAWPWGLQANGSTGFASRDQLDSGVRIPTIERVSQAKMEYARFTRNIHPMIFHVKTCGKSVDDSPRPSWLFGLPSIQGESKRYLGGCVFLTRNI